MDLGAAGLKEQPFPTHGKPLAVVSYLSQQDALKALQETIEKPTGLALLQGPALSGKSVLVRRFAESMDDACAVAVVDGKGLNTTNLLLAVLRQFGYEIDLDSVNELLGLVRVFALQQAAKNVAPVLVVENVHKLNPSALRTLAELAELRSRTGSALRIILVSDRSLATVMKSPWMQSVAKRLLHDLHMRPMQRDEVVRFLHDKLRAAGAAFPAYIFPQRVCEEIWKASGGWPGIVDRLALLALARADSLPVHVEQVEHPAVPAGTWDGTVAVDELPAPSAPAQPPRLVVTNNSSVMNELSFTKPRVLIGRSEHNDIAIGSRFVSRHHALLVRHGDTTILMDLNSTNGTFVNSRRVSNHVVIHDDVITVGHHKIKFSDPFARKRPSLDGDAFADTAIMKTLQDMRDLLAQENTALMPAVSENLPTIRT
jgi:type II secretory pathway predicted ATPase ExeA/pSer/pThr/pTyr-binding forkhead associated (FHA) protein